MAMLSLKRNSSCAVLQSMYTIYHSLLQLSPVHVLAIRRWDMRAAYGGCRRRGKGVC